MRADGRSPDALRPVEIQMGFVQNPAGSALIRAGRTLVLCTVHVAEQVPAFLRGTGRGWVTAEYSLLPGYLGKLSQAIGECGANIGDIVKLRTTGNYNVRARTSTSPTVVAVTSVPCCARMAMSAEP